MSATSSTATGRSAWPPSGQQGALSWRSAGASDHDAVLALMRAFYAEDQIAFEAASVDAGLRALWAEPALGAVLLLATEGAGGVREDAGYLVLTRCFSLEQGGSHALLDELYLLPGVRGRGLSQAALALARQWADAQGCAVLRLEVNRHNVRAKALYERAGFVDEQRDLLRHVAGDTGDAA